MQESTTAFRREEVTAMVLGKKKSKNDYRTFENDYRTFEAVFVGVVERSDVVIVMDPRNGARKFLQPKDYRKFKGRMAT